jgi:hypothetical protein
LSIRVEVLVDALLEFRHLFLSPELSLGNSDARRDRVVPKVPVR